MYNIVKITLENAMDLILAHKKASRLGERLNINVSTITAFSTAVVEVCREVIDRTDSGLLTLGLINEDMRFFLTAKISYDKSISVRSSDTGYQNALKLLPQVTQYEDAPCEVIELRIGLPRSNSVTLDKIKSLTSLFANEAPYTAYEALKQKNVALHEMAEKSEEALHQAEFNNELKNEFISLASHELKTPVTIIKAYTQIALAAGEKHYSPVIKSHLSRIEAQSQKLISLIQQLLDVSKIESGKLEYKMETVDLNTFLNDSFSQMKHIIPNHHLTIDLTDSVSVNLDTLRMEQVLSNIIGNAAKYSDASSRIEVTTRQHDQSVTVSVKDNGIGMSESDISKIFEKFHRNSGVVNKYSGLGMGLYISSKIIKEHKGNIWVESIEGEGSTFHFSLPCEQLA